MAKMPDLSNLSMEELETYREAVEKATKAVTDRRKEEARKAIYELVADYGFELHEVIDVKPPAKKKPVPAKPKYAHPDDPTKTWSGMGKTPAFIQELLDSGKTRDDLLIKNK